MYVWSDVDSGVVVPHIFQGEEDALPAPDVGEGGGKRFGLMVCDVDMDSHVQVIYHLHHKKTQLFIRPKNFELCYR